MRPRRFSAPLVLALFLAGGGALAQSAPSFWDPGRRLDRPDLTGVRALRFLTEDDYPPLNFATADGGLSGFNVEIARAICEELVIGCTIQARRFDTLVDSLIGGKGDAIVASLASSEALREKIDFSMPYYRTPARFAARADPTLPDPTPQSLKGRKVAAIAGSAHEAFLRAFFHGAAVEAVPDFASLTDALKEARVDYAFADGLTLAIWLAGSDSAQCCRFRNGPYLESRYFGEGVGVAVRKEDVNLRLAIDWALARLAQNGVYAELMRKYFPIPFE